MNQPHESLFYQAVDNKHRTVVINKKHIVSAVQLAETDIEVKTSSGETFHLPINFGDFLFQLQQIGHKNDQP